MSTSPSLEAPKAIDAPRPSIRFLDGGLGTSLEDLYGVKFDETTPLWSSDLLINGPEIIEQLQVDFSKAGAEILLTSTYQCSFHGFAATLGEGSTKNCSRSAAETYMRSAVKIARHAHDSSGRGSGQVALSLGAYGATTSPSAEYSGQYDAEHDTQKTLYDFHLDRVMVFFNDAKVWDAIDLIAFETLPRQDEVKAVREVMKTMTTNNGGNSSTIGSRPYWISCVFPNENLMLPDGTTIAQLCESMLSPDFPIPYAIGVNCTKLRLLRPIIAQFASVIRSTGLPQTSLVLYPDGANDLVYDIRSKSWEPTKEMESAADENSVSRTWDDEFHQIIQELQRDYSDIWEAFIIGGCCKTSPAMIKRLRQRIDS